MSLAKTGASQRRAGAEGHVRATSVRLAGCAKLMNRRSACRSARPDEARLLGLLMRCGAAQAWLVMVAGTGAGAGADDAVGGSQEEALRASLHCWLD